MSKFLTRYKPFMWIGGTKETVVLGCSPTDGKLNYVGCYSKQFPLSDATSSEVYLNKVREMLQLRKEYLDQTEQLNKDLDDLWLSMSEDTQCHVDEQEEIMYKEYDQTKQIV